MTLLKAHEKGTLTINAAGPELVRSQTLENGLFGVQTYSEKQGRWLTHAEHLTPEAAIEDAASWY